MGAGSVVVGLVPGQDRPQVPFAEGEHPVDDPGPGGEHEPFRKGVRPRASGRDLHCLDTGGGEDRVERIGELPGAVTDQEVELCGAVPGVHQEVADLLGGPWAVWMGGDPEDMNVAGAGFDDEQAVQRLQRQRAAGVDEIGGEHGRRLGVQELPPGCAGVPFRRGRNTQCLENPADRGRADPEAGLEQLALDPLLPPTVILAGEPPDQHGDLGADRRPPRPVRIGLLAGEEAAVPPKHGTGTDQPVCPQAPGQDADQRGEDRGRPSPGAAGDGCGAARQPRAAARAARCPWTPLTGPAGPSSRGLIATSAGNSPYGW
jgi:hypothetical protein